MRIFKDKELKLEIENNFLDCGTIDAGETKTVEFYVQNDELSTLYELSFKVDNKEVEIIEYPKEISSLEVKPLIIKCLPDVNLRRKVEARIDIVGKELWE